MFICVALSLIGKSVWDPDFLIFTTSEWGSISPLIPTQIRETSHKELIEFLKTFTSGSGLRDPTSEGLSDIIKSAALDSPARFARLGPKLIDDEIKASYIYAVLSGLESAWKDGEDFEWEPTIHLYELLVTLPQVSRQDPGQDTPEV